MNLQLPMQYYIVDMGTLEPIFAMSTEARQTFLVVFHQLRILNTREKQQMMRDQQQHPGQLPPLLEQSSMPPH